MRAVVQRVARAEVRVGGEVVGRCGVGLMVLVAAHRDDEDRNAAKMADRIFGMRIFADGDGRMNLALKDLEPSSEPRVLAVSNFTLLGDASQRRPSFVLAAPYERGQALFDRFVEELRELGVQVETGVFGAEMEVELANLGPVTIVTDC